jgi:hypothetical protein
MAVVVKMVIWTKLGHSEDGDCVFPSNGSYAAYKPDDYNHLNNLHYL